MIYFAYNCEERTPDVYMVEAGDIRGAISAFVCAYCNKNGVDFIKAMDEKCIEHMDEESGARLNFDGRDIEIDVVMNVSKVETNENIEDPTKVHMGKFNERFVEHFMRAF